MLTQFLALPVILISIGKSTAMRGTSLTPGSELPAKPIGNRLLMSVGGPFLARVLAADYRLLKAEDRHQQQLKDIRKDCANQHHPVFD
jgi:hypothetical protein